jgi:Ca2+-binding RTX toxin-like protein
MIQLTTAEIDHFSQMRGQAAAGAIGYWKIYQELADLLANKYGVPSTDSTLLWLRGATEANAGRGAMSALIREYTQKQYMLRYGTTLSDQDMQIASDAVTQNLLNDLLGNNELQWPKGQVPNISRIAIADAAAVGRELFGSKLGHDESDTAFLRNSAWSGALLFGFLGSDQTDRLIGTGTPGTLDTLNDLRDVLYATVSYARGLSAARSQYLSELAYDPNSGTTGNAQAAVDMNTMLRTAANYLTGDGSLSSLIATITNGIGSGPLASAVQTILTLGPNRFLDMILGATQGRAVIGSTTDANFDTRARSFFGELTPAQLQALPVRLLPTTAGSLASAAQTDVNVRAALAGLSIVSVQVSSEVASRFSLYDPITQTGQITQNWIADRAAMTSWVAQSDWHNGTALSAGPGVQGMHFQDMASGIAFDIGLPDNIVEKRQTLFGGNSGDSLIGKKLDDHLYGGLGNDTLLGQAGADYLEGNDGDDNMDGGSGSDTLLGGAGADVLSGGDGNDLLLGGAGTDVYRFNTGWGLDTIDDADGAGRIEVQSLGALSGTGAKKVAEGIWQTDDQKTNYTLVSTDAGKDLLITFSDRVDAIRVRDWQPGQLGIALSDTAPPVLSSNLLAGDLAKALNGNAYVLTATGYRSAGAQPGADDILLGTEASEQILGQAGNDGLQGGAGDDSIDGGAGDDLLLGGTGADTLVGGSGNDVIYGSAIGSFWLPTDVNFQRQAVPAGDLEFTHGFSWTTYRVNVPRVEVVNGVTFHHLRVASALGAGLSPFWQGTDGGYYVESSGNVIDAGAGDDFIAAGTGNDIVHAGSDNDDVMGLEGADVLFGDDGDDDLWGDGLPDPNTLLYVADAGHGNDVIDGGAGSDDLLGQGGNDVLYGSSGNDTLSGDLVFDADHHPATAAAIQGNDYLDGGEDDDQAQGDGGDDTLFGGSGNDDLQGDNRPDWVAGALHGRDYLDGEDGNDSLAGDGGDDELFGGTGNDHLWGDGGAQEPGPKHLAAQFHGNDYLDGEDGDDYLQGEGGADTLFGGAGDDTLLGDDIERRLEGAAHGADYLDGESGNDSLAGGGGADTLLGGQGNDLLRGDDLSANLSGTFHGNDYLDGGDGNDTLVIDSPTGQVQILNGFAQDSQRYLFAGGCGIKLKRADTPGLREGEKCKSRQNRSRFLMNNNTGRKGRSPASAQLFVSQVALTEQ